VQFQTGFLIMPVKLLVSVLIVLASMIVLFLFLLATDTALSVWQYLRQAPAWLQLSYLAMLVTLPIATLLLFWKWFRPASRKQNAATKSPQAAGDFNELQDELMESSRAGVDISPALAEINEQRQRKSTGEIYIAVHGEVSSGKSSLVKAILPAAEVDSDPRAGTTVDIRHYTWVANSGDRIIIADLPGFNLEDDSAALEETRRAHLVIFLCDSDLTGSQTEQLRSLTDQAKPLVLALNKSDRYSAEELEELRKKLLESSGLASDNVVVVNTGGKEEVVRLLGEGIEQKESRDRAPQISPLVHAVQRHLDENRKLMESLRDTAVLLLASEKLDDAKASHRSRKADELVSRFSRRAVVGALAAVAPGSDLLIQGVLATQLMRELSALYEVPVKELEIESFLKLAGSKIRNMTAITLAIAGNGLKAFPGLGTISGGLVHAVAYGMIFDSLGRAAAATLASRGALRPYAAAEAFEDLLHENLESGAVRFIKLAVKQKEH
jgi:GTP-binding protein EngB required for normal cell division